MRWMRLRRDALLHSGVFHPRLVGGMDTIFWQKLVHPLLQPGAPAFFLLDEADDGQKAVLCHLREVWDAVAQEVFDYENQVRYHLSAAVHPWQHAGARWKTKALSRSRSRPSA